MIHKNDYENTKEAKWHDVTMS